MVFQYPDSYAKAFWGLDGPYFSPVLTKELGANTLVKAGDTSFSTSDDTYASHEKGRSLWLNFYAGLKDAFFAPILKIIFSPGLYVWIVVIESAFLLTCRLRRYFVLAVPLLATIVVCLLGPVALMRYVMPLVLCAPVLFTVIMCHFQQKNPACSKYPE